MVEETIQDALIWVKTLIEHYQWRYPPVEALLGVKSEIETCIDIHEFCEGTRFKEATEQLKRVHGKALTSGTSEKLTEPFSVVEELR